MKLIKIIKKAFVGGDWFVAYRSTGEEKWKLAASPKEQWCADPFVFSDDTGHYIFVEQYLKNKEKGCIGYYRFIQGEPVNQGVIIENTYHMSYPCVFTFNNQYYMIPESSANSTVDLYMAEHFPDKWIKVRNLITGQKYVDSTVYQDGEDYYLISYCMTGAFEIHVFALDMEQQELRLLSKKRYEKNIARPGGRLFIENGKLMRPAQDCSQKYGESLIIYQVDCLNHNGEYTEHEVRRIKSNTILVENKPERIHQFTKDESYEVIDLFKEKLDFLHVPRIYFRSRRK